MPPLTQHPAHTARRIVMRPHAPHNPPCYPCTTPQTVNSTARATNHTLTHTNTSHHTDHTPFTTTTKCLACMSYLVCTTKQLHHPSPHHHHTGGGITSTFNHVASIASTSCQLAINGRAALLSGHLLSFHLIRFLIGLGAMMKNSGTLVCVINFLRFSPGCSFHLDQDAA